MILLAALALQSATVSGSPIVVDGVREQLASQITPEVVAQIAAGADPQPVTIPFEVNGFRTRIEVMIDAPRAEVFEAATGDVSPWWDHTFWPERPAELVIEPIFGGVFYERFEDGKDDGVIHASVTGVMPPQMLRMDGPLGLAGRGYQLVTTWTLEEADDGAATQFIIDLSMIGEVDAALAGTVRRVWVHFINDRLKPYVEAGCHLEPEASCAAFAED
ncbi:MAG: SRPBCC domain-containing protein [Alphaproteobacteria bacterium]|nr:SRPBCC domain-containing protein [Alphaproteobacteria bacterium]